MEKKMTNERKAAVIRTVCAMRDAAMCGLLAHLEDGIIKKVTPADFPDSADRGCCAVGLATPQLVYHTDRLRYPLKRIGERGEGKWERVSWEEALDGIAEKLQGLMHQYGAGAVAWDTDYAGAGNLKWAGYSRLASLTKGSWVNIIGIGDSAAPCADFATFGAFLEGLLATIPDKDCKLTIVWGLNPASTNFRFLRMIMDDKSKGAHLVCIDPRFTGTAARCDEHVAIRPGTDGALALAMIHVILEQGLQDERFIVEHTVGPLLVRDDDGLFLRESDSVKDGSGERFMVFDEIAGQVQSSDIPKVRPALSGACSAAGIACKPAFQLLAEMVKEYTLERAAAITDVPADTIRRLAIAYATQKPAAIRTGMGMQRSFHGDLSCRAINTLAAITGNINLNELSPFVLNPAFLEPGGPYNHMPIMMLYDAITKGEPSPIKAIWFAGENFLNQMPNVNRIVNELLPCLELIVVADFFMTATAKYADYVLPVATFYECVDLYDSYPCYSTYLQMQQKVIEPLYESKSDFQIAAALGRRMGLGEYFEKTEEQYLEELLASGHPSMEGITLVPRNAYKFG